MTHDSDKHHEAAKVIDNQDQAKRLRIPGRAGAQHDTGNDDLGRA
jgi:hypothetical protein